MSIPGIDLSNVLTQAAQVTQEQEEKSDGSGMKLVYPQNGMLKFRLLYNQKSGVAMRKFERHKINGKQVVCLSNYGQSCPICTMLDSISNAKGVDLWQLKRTTRGIAYAEFIESDYKWDNPQNAPTKGEIILLMFPWSVYTDLNRLLNSAGQNIYSLIASNVGGVFKITRYIEGRQTKYRTEIDPFDQQHQTCPTEEAYAKLLTDLPSLNEKFVPLDISDTIIKAAQTTADELNREYLSPQVYQPNVGTTGQNLGGLGQPPASQNQTYTDPNTGITYDLINNQWIPRPTQAPQVPPTPPAPPVPSAPPAAPLIPPVPGMPGVPSTPQVGGSNPPCFGKHGSTEINPNQCLMCPSEAACSMASGGR